MPGATPSWERLGRTEGLSLESSGKRGALHLDSDFCSPNRGRKTAARGRIYQGGPRQEEDTRGRDKLVVENHEEMPATALERRERKA